MRRFVSLVLLILLISQQAHACLRGGEELFFQIIPENLYFGFKDLPDIPDADLVAIVSVLDDKVVGPTWTHTANVTVIQVLKTIKSSTEKVKVGDTLRMKWSDSSCGPDSQTGRKGTIIAKTSTDNNGGVVLHPYIYMNPGHRIRAPVVRPEGYDSSPGLLQVKDRVPEYFAVILIGIVGTQSLDFINLDHSMKGQISPMYAVPPNGIMAIRIPVGVKQLSISRITTGRVQAGGIHPNETAQVDTPKLDIDRPGLYYVATLDTDHPSQFQTTPSPEQLKQFRADYATTVQGLEPINFKWPSQ